MGQANSKQEGGAVSDESRLLYPIGGGHVGEGPVYVNPIAEGSQQQLPAAQEKPGMLQADAGGSPAISNPVYEEDSAPASSSTPAKVSNGTVAAEAPSTEVLSKSAAEGGPSKAVIESAPAEEGALPVESSGSPVREKTGGDVVVPPKTPEGVTPPPTTAKHGPLYSSMPTYVRLGTEEPKPPVNDKTASAAPEQTTTTYSSSSKTQESSSSSHHIVSSSTLPELKTEQPLQADNSLDRPPAPPNTPIVPRTTEIEPDSGVGGASVPPGKSIKGGLSSSERGISKAVLESAKDYEKPVAGPSSVQEPVAEATAVDGPSTAVAGPSTAVAGPSTAVEEAAPVEAANSASAVKSRPLVQPPAPTTSEAVPDTAEGAPLAADTVVGGKKMGNTGSLVSQNDKVQPGCLCFSAPGSKKGKKTGTIGTDAPIYAGPAVTGVAIGGGALYDAKAAEPEPVVATSTATAEPAKEEGSIAKPETAADGVPPAVEEEKLAPSTVEPDSGAADPITAGAIASTSPAIPTKLDTQATAEPATAEPATTTSRGVSTGGTAVPIPIPIVIPVSGSQHNKDLSQDEAADLPPLKDASDLPSASPGSTAVVGGVVALPAGNSNSNTTQATQEAPAATAAESNVAGGAVLPGAAAAEAQKETAPVYEEPVVASTAGAASLQKDLPRAAEANESALSPAAATPGASSLEAPETETAAASGAALAAPLATKPSPKKAVSFKEDSLPPADPTLAETPAAAEEEAINHTDATVKAIPTTATPTHAAEEGVTVPGSILLTPIQETNLTRTDGSLGETAAAEPDYLSSAEISEMPGIGKSVPGTPETEAGSVLVGGSEEPKALTIPEKQMVESHEDSSPLSQIQRKHENAEERDLPSSSKADTALVGSSPGLAEEGATAGPSAGTTSAASPITDQGAAEGATASALAAGAGAGAVTAAAAAPLGKQLSARQSRKLERQASKKEAAARATALKDKEKSDKARFKEKRKEERAHKKDQAKRMQQERQQAGTSAPQLGGKSGGSRTTVGVFGFFSRPKKEEENEGEKAVTPESEAMGGAAISAGPSRVGKGAAGAGLSGPAAALGASGTSRSSLGISGDPSGVETGNSASGYLASQGIDTEGGSGRSPEGTPRVVSLEDATAEGLYTDVAPDETAEAPAIPATAEEPVASPEPEIAPLPVSTGESVPSTSKTAEEPAGPQDVAVVFAAPLAAGESTPTKDVTDAPAAPITPPQDEDSENIAAAGILASVTPKKEKKPKVKKAKTNRNIDYSAIHMQKVPESKLQEGYNPTTRQYDTKEGKRVAPGAFSPLRSSQPAVQQSAKLAKQSTLERKKSRKLNANEVIPLLPSRAMAPAGRGIEKAEASANKADYRPLSRSFA